MGESGQSGGRCCQRNRPSSGEPYFKPVDTDVKVVESDVPTTVTAPMMTIAMNEAIKAYSIAGGSRRIRH